MKNGEPTNEQSCIRRALRHVRGLYGPTPAADFGPIALKTVRQSMIDAGWTRKAINKQVERVRRMFRWGVENELIPAGTLHALQAVGGLREGRSGARETGPVRPVADEIVDATKPHVSRQAGAMIELQRLTGMRSGEVVAMRGRDIDTTGKIWIYTPESHKTQHQGRERHIYLGPRAQAEIEGFWKPDLSAYLFSPADAERERHDAMREQRQTKVQPSQVARGERSRRRANRGQRRRPPAERYTVDSYRRAIDRACDQAFPPRQMVRPRPIQTAPVAPRRMPAQIPFPSRALLVLSVWRNTWAPPTSSSPKPVKVTPTVSAPSATFTKPRTNPRSSPPSTPPSAMPAKPTRLPEPFPTGRRSKC